ncbi:MAG: stage III sporulation protein AF [Clostridia bacterium]|nr:stage III sporulation protein AF [Clostridia bacterium]
MINFMSTFVKNLSLALVIISILEMLLPNNKTKKYVKMIMGLYVLFSIIAPFIDNQDKINLSEFNTYVETSEEIVQTDVKVDQSSMDKRLNEIYEQELQKDIKRKIENKGYEIESCKIEAHISQEDTGIEKITIKIARKIGEENKEETIEDKMVSEIQKIQKVEVKVSEGEEEKEEESKITKTDVKIIKDFLKQEYGVSEQCLKIS